MRYQEGSRLVLTQDIDDAMNGTIQKAGTVVTLVALNHFGNTYHLAVDGKGEAWAIEGDSIDSKDPAETYFTVIKDEECSPN